MEYAQIKELKENLSFDFVHGAAINVGGVESVSIKNDIDRLINGVAIIRDGENYKLKINIESGDLDHNKVSRYLGVRHEDLVIDRVGHIHIQGLISGYCLGHYEVAGGTFGCYVKNQAGEIFVLSNNHVIANFNKGTKGDAILHPCAKNGGLRPKDIIATLHDFVPLKFDKSYNYVDCGIGKVVSGKEVEYNELPIIGRVNGVILSDIDMPVLKFGQYSNLTSGIVISNDVSIKVDYGPGFFSRKTAFFNQQIEIKTAVPGSRFSMLGDSGALVVKFGSNEAVGLVFAGTNGGVTYANPISTVFENFAVEIL